MRYLTVDDVLRINRSYVTEREPHADLGLLESAVMRPQQSVFGEDAYRGIHTKAAALMHALARNHPFVDGNKRTALTATVMFYGLNDWDLELDDSDAIDITLMVAEGDLDVGKLAEVLQRHARRPPPPREY